MKEERKAVLVMSPCRFQAPGCAPRRAGCDTAAAVANLCGKDPLNAGPEANFAAALRKFAGPEKGAVAEPPIRGAWKACPPIGPMRGAPKECPPDGPIRGALKARAAGAAAWTFAPAGAALAAFAKKGTAIRTAAPRPAPSRKNAPHMKPSPANFPCQGAQGLRLFCDERAGAP